MPRQLENVGLAAAPSSLLATTSRVFQPQNQDLTIHMCGNSISSRIESPIGGCVQRIGDCTSASTAVKPLHNPFTPSSRKVARWRPKLPNYRHGLNRTSTSEDAPRRALRWWKSCSTHQTLAALYALALRKAPKGDGRSSFARGPCNRDCPGASTEN